MFVAPELDPKHGEMMPLIEEERQMTWDTGASIGSVLYLTLRINNRFAVNFSANHVRIY